MANTKHQFIVLDKFENVVEHLNTDLDDAIKLTEGNARGEEGEMKLYRLVGVVELETEPKTTWMPAA